jgi:uncharacterized membrane protein YfbV (UPF0208 family)
MTALFTGILAAFALLWFLLVEFEAFRAAMFWLVVGLIAIVAALSLTGQAIYWYGKRTNRWGHR